MLFGCYIFKFVCSRLYAINFFKSKIFIFVAMVRLLSYIFPITKRVKSQHNGILEITWHNGKKYLNTKNANYSFGSLQDILKFGLEKIDLKNTNSILLLGLGAGCVIDTLQNDLNYKGKITAIEIDSVIIDVAKKEFNLNNYNNLEIICDDALYFVEQNKKQFDLVIIDLFIDTKMPKQFLNISFWKNILKSNSKNGSILFNASLENLENNTLKSVEDFLIKNNYNIETFNKVNETNTIVIAKTL